jgi:hypothetical protein
VATEKPMSQQNKPTLESQTAYMRETARLARIAARGHRQRDRQMQLVVMAEAIVESLERLRVAEEMLAADRGPWPPPLDGAPPS